MREELLQERKKAIYGLICDELYVPMKAKEIAAVLNVPKSDRRDLAEVLDALVAEGKVEVSSKGKYMKSEGKFLTGVFAAHPRGFGFVTVEGENEDIFIPESQVNGAFHGDTVQVALTRAEGHGRRREGQITKILTRGVSRIVCTYEKSKTFGFAVPDNPRFGQDIFIPQERSKGAVSGHKVVVELTDFGGNGKKPEGKVVEILGHVNDPGTDILSIVRGYDLPTEFPEKIMNQVERVAGEVSTADMAGRMDLRDWQTVTIDGEDAKDLDDAITLTKEGDVYRLGVHIADVSHYVRPDTALDKEAYERATSIYYADKVIPMLPTQLSNGICSLNEGEERLAFSCLMQLDESGNIHSYQFVKSVIRSRVKGVYKEINALLDGSNDPALVTKYKDVMAQLPAMTELYEKRLALRKARGAMDIESDEAKLVMDEEGRCVDIVKRTRGVSECMIEEFMLLANQCAANAGRTHHVPFVYRIHEAPDAERMEKLSNTLKACGLNVHFAGEVPTQLELSAILDETRGQPIQIPVHTGILRSMQKARYSPEPKGHYGLVLADYAHFTSPIRRYPDLAIHRILTDMLVGKPEQELIKDYTGFATHASEQSSRQEVSAVRIERDVEDLYKAEYMHNHLGEVYTGTVAGVTPRGIFVALENTVEGFVPAAQLCKGEATVVEGVSILDPLTGKRWMLGDPVKVQVAGANVALGRIDFDYMPL